MANENNVIKKYVSLEKLGYYDSKIKEHLANADAATLAEAKQYFDDNVDNFDAAGAAATAEENAKAYADTKDEAIAEAKGIGEGAATAASAAQTDVDNLAAYVGEFTASEGVDTIAKYIDAKTANIASDETVSAIDGRVEGIEKDYLKAADKTELQGNITAANTAVDTEKSRAEGIESGLRTDIDAVKGDYLKAADKTELQGNINTVSAAVERLTNGVSADEVDGVNDLIAYVNEHGTEVTGMQEDISENATAIAGVAGRMDTAEGKISAVEGAVAEKAAQSEVNTISGKVGTLEGDMTQAKTDIDAVEVLAAANETAIGTLNTTVAGKADNADLEAAVARIEAVETWQADITEATNEEIDALFGDGGNGATKTFTIQLDENEYPEANLLEFTVPENATWNDAIGSVTTNSIEGCEEGYVIGYNEDWGKVTVTYNNPAINPPQFVINSSGNYSYNMEALISDTSEQIEANGRYYGIDPYYFNYFE